LVTRFGVSGPGHPSLDPGISRSVRLTFSTKNWRRISRPNSSPMAGGTAFPICRLAA